MHSGQVESTGAGWEGQAGTARLWLFGLFCLSLPLLIIVYQALTPSDGARISQDPRAWSSQGILLRVYAGEPGGLQDGDRLAAVDGVPVETLAEGLFHPGGFQRLWGQELPAVYRVVRDGRAVDVDVRPGRQPLGAIAAEHWGLLTFALVTQALALFVFLRRPGEPAARALFVWGMTSGHFYVWSSYRQVPDLLNGWGFWLYTFIALFLWLANWGAGVHLTMTFPRPLPAVRRRPALLFVPYLAAFGLYALFVALSRLTSASSLEWIRRWGQGEYVVPIAAFLPVVWILIHQYRLDRSESGRKKMRLVVFSMLAVSSLTVLFYILPVLLGLPGLDANFLGVLLLLFPASIGIAILRYQLFDIDVIIRRTLVYGILTAALALVYWGSVVVLQEVYSYFTGLEQRSPAAVVLSTLAIATLFNPLRDAIQGWIDRRFYRRRYNAEQVLAAFSATLRGEIDLDRLARSILDVVEETVQPAHVSLWLRDAGPVAMERHYEETRSGGLGG